MSRAADRWAPALVAAGLAVRLSTWAAVFRGGRVLFVDADDYYHLRRIMAAAANFPRLPAFDAYLGFPTGFAVNWPPLYDQFVGLLTLVAGLGRPDLRLSALVAAWVPPLAGAVALWLFARVARRICGEEPARWSLAFGAVLPLLVFYTLLGRPDHHCFENLWFLATLAFVFRLLDARRERYAAKAAASAAAAAALGVLFWIGSIVFSAVLFLFAAVELLSPRRPARAFFWLGAAFLAEAALVSPVCLFSRWAAEGAVLFDAPSAFQPLALAAAGLWTWGLYWRRVDGWRTGRAALACAAAFLVTAALAWSGAESLARYAFAPLPVFKTFTEMQPLLAPYGRWSLEYVSAYFGAAFWLLPPLAFLFARAAPRDPARRLLLAWAAVTGALALWQTRYAYHFCLPAAVLLGWGAERAVSRLTAAAKTRRLPAPGALSRAAVLAAAALLLLPALKNVAALALTAPENVTGSADLIEACDWLRGNAPPTRSLWRDEGAPEYGVYSLHTVGDQIAAIAQRPAAAGNMHFLPAAIMNSIRFFFMDDPRQAYDFLRAGRFRYLLLGDDAATGVLPSYARLFGLDAYSGGPADARLVYTRLYSGSARLAHFRLVHESPTRAIKVFALVP